MNLEQALNVLAEACAKFVGNLADHQAIQTALSVVREHVTPAVDVTVHEDEAPPADPE